MAPRGYRYLAVFAAASFSLIAFVFSLLATTSHRWAIRDYYDTVIPEDWNRPNFTISRSPFHICTTSPKFKQSTSSDGEPVLTLVKYNTECYSFAPFGSNQTSCELRSVTKTDNATTVGDARLCQQIHAAGNFAISSSVFISLGFLLVLLLSMLAAAGAARPRSKVAPVPPVTDDRHEGKGATGEAGPAPSRKTLFERRRRHRTFQSVHFVSATFLSVGAVLGIISQFYGILGLIQSAPNNADWASSAAGNSKDVDTSITGYHGPWYQGDALSVYLTCAWAFSLATPVITSKMWSWPRLGSVD